MKTKNKSIKFLIKYLSIFLMFYNFKCATIFDVCPFTVALLFALMWTGFNVYAISIEFFAVEMLSGFSLPNLYINLVILFVMLVVYFVHCKIKKPMNIWLVGVYMLLATSCYIYYMIVAEMYLALAVYMVLLYVSFFMYTLAFQVTILRGLYYKLTLNESIAFVYILMTLGLGLGAINCFNFSFVKLFVVATIIFLNLIRKEKLSYISALSIGVGAFLGSMNGELIANIVVILLGSSLFHFPQRYYMAVSALLVDFCYQIFMNLTIYDSVLAVLPTAMALTIVLLLPTKIINQVQDKFYITESEMSMRNIVNISRSNLHRRFNELSNVFAEMKEIHLGLIKENLGQEQIVKLLTDEVMKGLCKDCLNKNKCYRAMGEEEFSQVAKLIDIAIKKGKLTLLDIPSNLAIRCGMVNLLIGRINQSMEEYNQFVGVKNDINNVKYLLAEQIGAVGQIMLDLGNEIDKHITFDSHKESQIISELLQENIVCSEVLLYNENNDNINVDLIVKGDNAFNPKIEKIISKKMKKKMVIKSSKPIEVSGFYAVTLEQESNFDIVFGLASYTKTGSSSSGDSHSLLKLGKNKYLLALCDGMGSGDEANRTSALTIGLIENFFKAGFDNDIIITSINKLLSLNNQENFSTLDLCLLNLDSEVVDFIKVGAPFSIIKRESSIEKIEGGALPVGVLDSVTPFAYQTTIDTKSMIVMMTDGVTDAFGDIDKFNDFVKGIVSTNPQTIAQTIIDEAVRRNDNVNKDDMTILVVRSFRKNN